MEYHPNLSAVRFFRMEVWPLLRQRWPALIWRLVGKNPTAVSRFTAGDTRIEVTGEVDDAVRAVSYTHLDSAGSGPRLQDRWHSGRITGLHDRPVL